MFLRSWIHSEDDEFCAKLTNEQPKSKYAVTLFVGSIYQREFLPFISAAFEIFHLGLSFFHAGCKSLKDFEMPFVPSWQSSKSFLLRQRSRIVSQHSCC